MIYLLPLFEHSASGIQKRHQALHIIEELIILFSDYMGRGKLGNNYMVKNDII